MVFWYWGIQWTCMSYIQRNWQHRASLWNKCNDCIQVGIHLIIVNSKSDSTLATNVFSVDVRLLKLCNIRRNKAIYFNGKIAFHPLPPKLYSTAVLLNQSNFISVSTGALANFQLCWSGFHYIILRPFLWSIRIFQVETNCCSTHHDGGLPSIHFL